jgi:hypothetical protein
MSNTPVAEPRIAAWFETSRAMLAHDGRYLATLTVTLLTDPAPRPFLGVPYDAGTPQPGLPPVNVTHFLSAIFEQP